MSRFLLTVWPLRTHLGPFMSVARGLRERGHDVAFYTGGTGLDFVREQGFRCFAFQAVDDARVELAIQRLIAGNWRPGAWKDFMLGSVPGQLRDLEETCKSWQPHVLLCDIAMWGPILVLHESRSLPVALLSHVAFCLLPGEDNPLPGADWLLKGTPLRAVAPLIVRIWQSVSGGVPEAANNLRRTWGLPPLPGTVTEFTGKMPLYLIPGTPAFDGDRTDLPPSTHYVGPCVWDQHTNEGLPQRTARFPRDLPCVVVVEGAVYPQEPHLLRTAVRALSNLPLNVVLVAGEGRNLDGLDLGPLAPNIQLESWTPLGEVLPIADVVVAGGSSAIVMACLQRKLPMVLVPRILDEPETSWRVSSKGAGVRIPRWKCSPQRLARAVGQVLAEHEFRDNAARLAEDFADFTGADLAARLLEDLARSALPGRSVSAPTLG
jgi:UDP:flavonoid glycosyltransferase YjiC (YdhE family)